MADRSPGKTALTIAQNRTTKSDVTRKEKTMIHWYFSFSVLPLTHWFPQIVGELVTGRDVPYVRKEGTELYMPLQNLSGVVLVELVPEVTLHSSVNVS